MAFAAILILLDYCDQKVAIAAVPWEPWTQPIMPWMRAWLMMGVRPIVGTNGVVLSPFSTVGALACGCAPEGVDVNRLYKNLLLTAILFSVSAFVVSYLGIYTKLFL